MDKKIRFKFSKVGEYKYFSHLDIINILLRALRRAQIRVRYSEGFNPKPRIAFNPPIPLGIESIAEYADVTVLDNTTVDKFLSALNGQLEGKIIVSDAREVPLEIQNLMNQVDIAEYLIRIVGSDVKGKSVLECAEMCLEGLELKEALHGIEKIRSIKDKRYILLRFYAYVRTFNDRNEKVFKLKDFLECFGENLTSLQMMINSVVKEELFILEDDKKLTPFEVL